MTGAASASSLLSPSGTALAPDANIGAGCASVRLYLGALHGIITLSVASFTAVDAAKGCGTSEVGDIVPVGCWQ